MLIVSQNELDSYVGYTAEPTDWFLVTQEQINAFADTTKDHQFIHVDPERAKETPFGGTIAHGFLTLSMVSYFSSQFSIILDNAVMGVNYGFDKIRFMAPVPVDSEIRARAKVKSIEKKAPGQYLVRYDVTVDIKGHEKPALVAEWLAMQFTS